MKPDQNSTYSPATLEKKWREQWGDNKIFAARDFDKEKEKVYVLVEFPYPSGEGLHVGHCLSYIAQDIIARYLRMQGRNVLYPMGWDAFGLPTENFAIKNKIKPQVATAKNIANFKRQIQALGISFDWLREVNTTDPQYYKWTQWIFLQLFKHGLADKKEVAINWCPKDKIGLAFEEVIDGKCERCGTQTERRVIKQWVLKITKYADRLIDDLDTVDFLPEIKQQQINWIGRSEGAEIEFRIKNLELGIKVFTTRVDTIFSAAFLIVAPEHGIIQDLKTQIQNWKEVEKYTKDAKSKSDRERQEDRDKTGVELQGVVVINPASGKEIPVWISDFVLASYGTGAVFADAHDERDFVMAKKYGIPLTLSLRPTDDEQWTKVKALQECYTDDGILINSEQFDGMTSAVARVKITEWLAGKGAAQKKVNYKLRDWIFSRQHYWGEPIPIIICEKCGHVPLDEKDLPLTLPDVKFYEPTDTGESPLAKITDWVETKCPNCAGPAKRETDTMPNWAGSSWYFMRYTDPHNDAELADKKKLKYWMPVDLYNGGAEHTTLHLLYSRFWYKFLFDIGIAPGAEPYQVRVHHGMILAPDGQKMSKSRGNVINPDAIVEKYGADIFRLYMMFMGEYDQVKLWNDEHIKGAARFIYGVWNWSQNISIIESSDPMPEFAKPLAQAIQGVAKDIERRSFNTAVSKLMVCWNHIAELTVPRNYCEQFIKLLAPFAPFLAEELWQTKLGHTTSIHLEQWPTVNAEAIAHAEKKIAIQVNGKVRADIMVASTMSESQIRDLVFANPQIQKYIPDPTKIKNFIYKEGKIVSIVV